MDKYGCRQNKDENDEVMWMEHWNNSPARLVDSERAPINEKGRLENEWFGSIEFTNHTIFPHSTEDSQCDGASIEIVYSLLRVVSYSGDHIWCIVCFFRFPTLNSKLKHILTFKRLYCATIIVISSHSVYLNRDSSKCHFQNRNVILETGR